MTLDDIPVVIAMGRALHAESPRYSRLSFSDDKVTALVRSMVSGTLVTEPAGGAFVAEKNGQIVGMFGGFITTLFFSDDKIASDYTFYIAPEHRRRGRAALALLFAFEAWAIGQGAVDIVTGVSTMIDVEGTASFYQKLGYVHHGCMMIKRIQ